MHSDWFNGIDIFRGRWQHGEKVGYCYPSGLEKTLCKWDMYVPAGHEGVKKHMKVFSSSELALILRAVCGCVYHDNPAGG
jgi:hypothetical protein